MRDHIGRRGIHSIPYLSLHGEVLDVERKHRNQPKARGHAQVPHDQPHSVEDLVLDVVPSIPVDHGEEAAGEEEHDYPSHVQRRVPKGQHALTLEEHQELIQHRGSILGAGGQGHRGHRRLARRHSLPLGQQVVYLCWVCELPVDEVQKVLGRVGVVINRLADGGHMRDNIRSFSGVRYPSVGQNHGSVKPLEHSGGGLVDSANDDDVLPCC
mmetsp:Transcript_31946/g.49911  ORF Transcript_31946/g.49911 Transcript_31946/m.49911 type:complete len:212 (+) Transcript_31946:1182-1817(+)